MFTRCDNFKLFGSLPLEAYRAVCDKQKGNVQFFTFNSM